MASSTLRLVIAALVLAWSTDAEAVTSSSGISAVDGSLSTSRLRRQFLSIIGIGVLLYIDWVADT